MTTKTTKEHWTIKMVQQRTVFAAKPRLPEFEPWDPLSGERKQAPTSCPLNFTHTVWHTHAQTRTNGIPKATSE